MAEMRSAATTTLQQITSRDGLRAVSIVKSAGGFRFVEETYSHEKNDTLLIDFWYWEPTYESGIYATEQEALTDAFKTLPWLRISTETLPPFDLSK